MARLIDLTGQRFGKLVVLARAENSKGGNARWLCRCDCGGETVTSGGHLRCGHTLSCGCVQRKRTSQASLVDLTGQRFDRLLVVERAENNRHGQTRWRCRCDCGNEVVVTGNNLRMGRTKSCGCLLSRECRSQRAMIDLTGQRFGRLVALYPTEKRSHSGVVWMCRCSCGNETPVSVGSLRSGNTRSCGCLQRERASNRVRKDLAGQVFGRLTALKPVGRSKYQRVLWLCQCECGNTTVVRSISLLNGLTRSCGCLKKEIAGQHLLVHGGYANGNEPGYPEEWTNEFREAVRARDGYQCQVCGKAQEENGKALDVHHIDYDREHTTMENCIALCGSCHSRTNHARDYWAELFQWYMARREEAQ